MARRPGMVALAAAAGVSVATIDRLLNGREGVRAETAAAIRAAAQRMGHPALARLSPLHATDLPTLRLGVVLHKKGQSFYRAFATAITQAITACPGYRVTLAMDFATSQSPAEMAALIRSMTHRCDVLAATAVNHPEILSAVSDVQSAGIPVFSLLSDFAPKLRSGYVGMHNHKIGRVAGWMLRMAAPLPGSVAVFVGGARWLGHEQRDAGLRAYLRDHAPHLRVLDTVVNLETRQLTHDATMALLASTPDLRGIYVAGGGMEGAITALKAHRKPGDIALIVNELTPESRNGLQSGHVTLAIGTPLDLLTRSLVGHMAAAAFQPQTGPRPPLLVAPELHIAESL